MSQPALTRLANVLPPERLLLQPARLAAYATDVLTSFRAAHWRLPPPNPERRSLPFVRVCRGEKLYLVGRRSGTSLSGGSLPVAGGMVIALNRLHGILRLDAELRVAIVEPGVFAPAPRALLRAVVGLELAEITDPGLCCGTAGTYHLDQPAVAADLAERKAGVVIDPAVRGVISGNIGGMTQLRRHLARLGSGIRVWHTMRVLRDASSQSEAGPARYLAK